MKSTELLGRFKYLILGAGHQGLAMASHFSLNGERVYLWNRTESHIEKVKKNNEIICRGIVNGNAHIEKISTRIEDVLTDTIYVTVPSTAYKNIARMLAKIILPNSIIFLNPGRTFGAIEFMEELLKCGCEYIPIIVETQSIVYTCRRNEDNEAYIYALKNNIKMSFIGKSADKEKIIERIPRCIRKNFVFVDSVLYTSLGNVGMILHCAPVLMNIGWIECEKYEFSYYYDGITPTIGSYIQKMDEERLAVSKAIGIDTPSLVTWFHESYGVKGDSIFECIQNNEYYREIDAPTTLEHRYLDEDVSNGLVPIEYVGKELNVDVTHISLIIDLACAVRCKDYRKLGRQYNIETIKRYL